MSIENTSHETGPDGSPRDHWTHTDGANGSTWYRHTWPANDATGIVDAFIQGTAGDVSHIIDADGATIAYLVSADTFNRMDEVGRQFQQAAEQPDTTNVHPAFQGPRTDETDAFLIDTDDIRRSLAHAIALIAMLEQDRPGRDGGVTTTEITTERERIMREHSTALIGAASEIGAKLQLWPDSRGVVPVRRWVRAQHSPDCAREEWGLGYVVDGVRGLFVLGETPSLIGETWQVVTGSGYGLRGGFVSREYAAGFAVAVAAAVPGIDWRVFNAPLTALPDSLRNTLTTVWGEWGPFGKRETRSADESLHLPC